MWFGWVHPGGVAMVILSSPLVVIDVSDVDHVCDLLKRHASDWEATLNFLYSFAADNGYELNFELIESKMKAYYGE